MEKRGKWDIPEVFERDILRPMAMKLVEQFKKELDTRYFYEVSVNAHEDRENGMDRIEINILDGDGEHPEQTIHLDLEIPENPELIYKAVHGDHDAN